MWRGAHTHLGLEKRRMKNSCSKAPGTRGPAPRGAGSSRTQASWYPALMGLTRSLTLPPGTAGPSPQRWETPFLPVSCCVRDLQPGTE